MISQLSAKYQFGAMHTADTTDGKVTNAPPFVHRIRESTPFILARHKIVERLQIYGGNEISKQSFEICAEFHMILTSFGVHSKCSLPKQRKHNAKTDNK